MSMVEWAAMAGTEATEVIGGPRGSGRTTRMLRWLRAAKKGEARVIVCHSNKQAMRLFRTAREDPQNKLESWQFVGPAELNAPGAMAGVLQRQPKPRIVVGVDEAEMILQRLVCGDRFEVKALSVTTEF